MEVWENKERVAGITNSIQPVHVKQNIQDNCICIFAMRSANGLWQALHEQNT